MTNTRADRSPLWTDDRIISELSEHSSREKNDWNAGYELLCKMSADYERHIDGLETTLATVPAEDIERILREHDACYGYRRESNLLVRRVQRWLDSLPKKEVNGATGK